VQFQVRKRTLLGGAEKKAVVGTVSGVKRRWRDLVRRKILRGGGTIVKNGDAGEVS